MKKKAVFTKESTMKKGRGPKVRRRRQCTFTLSEEVMQWVDEVSDCLELPVSRIVELCIRGEKESMTGTVARGLAGMYLAVKKGREGFQKGSLNEA